MSPIKLLQHKYPKRYQWFQSPEKNARALQLILHVFVVYNAHTATKYFHIPFLKGIFSFKSCAVIGLLNPFNGNIETESPLRSSKRIIISEVETHFFSAKINLEMKQNISFSHPFFLPPVLNGKMIMTIVMTSMIISS